MATNTNISTCEASQISVKCPPQLHKTLRHQFFELCSCGQHHIHFHKYKLKPLFVLFETVFILSTTLFYPIHCSINTLQLFHCFKYITHLLCGTLLLDPIQPKITDSYQLRLFPFTGKHSKTADKIGKCRDRNQTLIWNSLARKLLLYCCSS